MPRSGIISRRRPSGKPALHRGRRMVKLARCEVYEKNATSPGPWDARAASLPVARRGPLVGRREQGPGDRRHPRGRATTSRSRRRPWPWPRSRGRSTPSTPTPISSTPRASPGCARTTRASITAWACRSRSRATASSSSRPSRAARPTAWASCPATSSRASTASRRCPSRAMTPCRSSAARRGRRSPSPSSARAPRSRST